MVKFAPLSSAYLVRRLGVALAFVGLVVCGCKRDHAEGGASGSSSAEPAASAPLSSGAILPPIGPEAKRRAACAFGEGALPKDTLDHGAPLGADIPIDHVIVVMQENRSFDHYFQKLPEYGQPAADVAPETYENADPTGEGELVHPYKLDDPCVDDVPHNWVAVHHAINGGKMDGFLSAANPRGRRAIGYYDQTTLPFYYALANTFAIGDRYFAAVPGPTFPNRMFFLSASSFGHAVNTPPPPRDEEKTLFHQLEHKGLSWTVYSQARTFEEQMYPRLHAEKGVHFRPVKEFFDDAANGKLPFFTWIESTYGGREATDEHAPGDVQVGQAFVASIVGALFASNAWPRSALFLMYDEHGGFFDHVAPPHACPPDDEPPRIKGISATVRFDQLGVRVPFIVVSPFAKAHYVSHRTYSHTSVLRFVQARADLPALTRRDANADAPFDLFDFSHPAFVTPPKLPEAAIDRNELERCLDREVVEEPGAPKTEPSPSAPTPERTPVPH